MCHSAIAVGPVGLGAGAFECMLVRTRRKARTYKYAEVEVGVADDVAEANGIDTFDFGQAQERALEAARMLSIERRVGGVPITVAEAMKEYMRWYAEHRKSVSITQCTIDAHINPVLGDIRLSALTSAQIRKWQSDLTKAPRRKRGGGRVQMDSSDPEEIRKLAIYGQPNSHHTKSGFELRLSAKVCTERLGMAQRS